MHRCSTRIDSEEEKCKLSVPSTNTSVYRKHYSPPTQTVIVPSTGSFTMMKSKSGSLKKGKSKSVKKGESHLIKNNPCTTAELFFRHPIVHPK
mmetsp:Transcript_2459/g.3614  ORF Transcript_2459/g.3614 Transcript_2459/m.3614 type:complete len:93 (+) Transcript_2459:278-556(+)